MGKADSDKRRDGLNVSLSTSGGSDAYGQDSSQRPVSFGDSSEESTGIMVGPDLSDERAMLASSSAADGSETNLFTGHGGSHPSFVGAQGGQAHAAEGYTADASAGDAGHDVGMNNDDHPHGDNILVGQVVQGSAIAGESVVEGSAIAGESVVEGSAIAGAPVVEGSVIAGEPVVEGSVILGLPYDADEDNERTVLGTVDLGGLPGFRSSPVSAGLNSDGSRVDSPIDGRPEVEQLPSLSAMGSPAASIDNDSAQIQGGPSTHGVAQEGLSEGVDAARMESESTMPVQHASPTIEDGSGLAYESNLERPSDGGAESTLPADLALPSIDFSLPSFGTPAASSGKLDGLSSNSQPPAFSASGEMTAQFQLPSFPDLGIPSVNTTTPPPADDAGQVPDEHMPSPPEESSHKSRIPEGPPRLPPSLPRAGVRQRAAATPPGMPAVQQRPAIPTRGGGGALGGLPDVSALALPDINTVAPKAELTLISADAADAVRKKLQKKRAVTPFLLVAVILAVFIGVLVQRDAIIASVTPAASVDSVADKALEAKVQWAQGIEAFRAKDYDKAIKLFEGALRIDETFGDAHRSLGIVFATVNRHAKAVEHYRDYVKLRPKADDLAAVKKIISDYEKARSEGKIPDAPKETSKTGSKNDRKGKKRRR